MLSIALRRTLHRLGAWLAVIAVSWLLFGQTAHAQTTGQLRGTVYDDQGLEVPGATVTLSGDQMIGGSQTVQTNAMGQYRFVQLLPGIYELNVTPPVFEGSESPLRPQTIEGVQVNVNATAVIDVNLTAGEMDTIVVEQGTAIDTESTTIGQVLTKEFLQKVPTGRSYQDAVQLSVGVTGGANPNMGGGAANENTFLLDGATVTDPVTGTFGNNFNFDAIQQIETILGGFDPEYGQSLGGIINIVTESGTNNLEFETSAFYINGNWRPRKDERFTSDGFQLGPTGFDQTFQIIQIAGKVSGPLVQDKAWFVLSYQHSRSLIAANGIPQQRDFDGHYLLAKLTVQPNSAHRITALFQTDPTTIDNIDQGNPFTKAEAQGRQAQSGFVGQLRWQWFVNPDTNLDTRVSLQKISIEQYSVACTHNPNSDSNKCEPDELEGSLDLETPGRIGAFGAFSSVNFGQYYFDDRWRVSVSSKFSALAIEDPLGGQHDIKIGIETEQLINNTVQGVSGNVLYVDLNEAAANPETFKNYYWQETTGPIRQRNTGSVWAAFVQDAYKPVNNVTIRYGLRLDNTLLRNDLGEPVIRGTMFAPRLFAAWDPFGDQKMKIAGGYGRFNESGRQAVAGFTSISAFGSKLFFGEFFQGAQPGLGPLNTQELMFDINPKQNPNVAHDRLRLPSVDELNLIIQRQIVTDVTFGVNFQAKFTRHLYEPDEVNLIYDEDGSQVIGSRRANPLINYLRLRTPREARRNYYRLDFTLAKRQSRRWGGQATYSYTFINGTSNNSLSGTFANDPQNQFAYGPLATASQHSARVFGFWDIAGTDPNTTTIGGSLIYNSGIPLERLYWNDQGGGFSNRVRNRNFYWQFNDIWELSVSVQQAIDVRRGRLLVDLQLLNALNNRAPVSFNGAFFRENRLFAVQRQDPLRIQLGIRYQF